MAPITVRFGPTYERDLKRASLGDETAAELQTTWDRINTAFETNPSYPSVHQAGTAIVRNNREVYKMRVADPKRNEGKSGSYRLIYWWREQSRELIGLYFYHNLKRKTSLKKKSRQHANGSFLGPPRA
jgi:mRNA-degrading endonuclease RelE of RelBE toxin-antitoxin system